MVPPVCRPSFSHVSRSAITAELHLALSSAKILFSSCRVYGNRADHVRHGSSSARCPRSLPETTRLTTFTDRAGVGIGSGKKWTACTAKTFGDHAAKLDAPHPNRNNVFFSMAGCVRFAAAHHRVALGRSSMHRVVLSMRSCSYLVANIPSDHQSISQFVSLSSRL